MRAYILIRVEAGKENYVLDEVTKVNGIRRASLVFGPVDIIAEIEVLTHDELEKIVSSAIRKIAGVKDSVTLVVAEERFP